MKRKSLFIAIVLCFFMASSFAYAQQDPNDPGEADTVYFEAWSYYIGDTLLISPGVKPWDVGIIIYLKSDNPINGLIIPLVDSIHGDVDYAYLDPGKNNPDTSFVQIKEFDSLVVDLSYHPPQVLYAALDPDDSITTPWWGSSIVKMIYTVYSSLGGLCLDSLTFPTAEKLQLRRTDGIYYTPQFKSKCFVLSEVACSTPDVSGPGNVFGLEGDTISYEIQACDPQADMGEDNAQIEIFDVASGDPLDSAYYSLTTLDFNDAMGIWRVEFYPEGLEFGRYNIQFGICDYFYFCGYVMTTAVYTRRGDADADGDVELADVIFMANYLLKGGEPPWFTELGDVNCNGGISLDDVIYLANHLLKGGPEPCAEQ